MLGEIKRAYKKTKQATKNYAELVLAFCCLCGLSSAEPYSWSVRVFFQINFLDEDSSAPERNSNTRLYGHCSLILLYNIIWTHYLPTSVLSLRRQRPSYSFLNNSGDGKGINNSPLLCVRHPATSLSTCFFYFCAVKSG